MKLLILVLFKYSTPLKPFINKVVFLLLGNNAKKKKKLIDCNKHIVITGVHPSPLSAKRGFFNSDVFKKINNSLLKEDLVEIDWSI